MINTEIVNPNIANLVLSLRDIGYSFEVAAADLVDNSITACASNIYIHSVINPSPIFCMLDDGVGMTEDELVEAMRLSSKSPLANRKDNDLGRFGLGLKTASFSQCKKLTVISKKGKFVSSRQWDLDFISRENAWLLITPENIEHIPLYEKLMDQPSGTLVCWESIDRLEESGHALAVNILMKHLALVFHRYLEGVIGKKLFKIFINNNPIIPFNPFNSDNAYTQELPIEKTWLQGSLIKIQPYILPHHSKISQQEYNLYATEEGYIKSQGFYLYRKNRILIHGTWWGLHKAIDAHKLVRIKIDIENDIDHLWSIDVKKSIARPCDAIKNNLKKIINLSVQRGSKPFIGRAKKIEDKSVIQVWEYLVLNNEMRFGLNRYHPLYKNIFALIDPVLKIPLDVYLKSIEAFLPIEAIQYNIQANPHEIKQENALGDEEIAKLIENLRNTHLSEDYINELFKTELLKNHTDLIK